MNRRRKSAATTQDIARASGVSTATVSYVLSGRTGVRISQKTRDKVLEAARALQYRPNALATALRTGRTNTIGIVAPYAIVGHPSFSQLVYGKDLMLALSYAAARAGQGVMFYADAPESPLRPDKLTDRSVDGVILTGRYADAAWVESVAASKTPCVEISASYGEYQVHPDDYGGARTAIEHLLSLGHRRIAHWRGPESAQAARERERAFFETMSSSGGYSTELPVVFEVEEVERLFRRADRPTALFTYNDNRAVDALHVLRDMGLRVPEDVSVVGFDNDVRASAVIPRLTTVQNPVHEIAQAAVRLLLAQIAGEDVSHKVVRIPTHLVVRESTRPPQAGKS